MTAGNRKAAQERAVYTKEKRQADTLEMIHAINMNAERRRVEDALYERMDAERRADRKRRANDLLAMLIVGAVLLAGACWMWLRTDAFVAAVMGV